MISIIPLENGSQKIVLIDDDELCHLSWQRKASKLGLELETFFTIEEFIKSNTRFCSSTKIFIDSNLGNGLKGEIESEKLLVYGFENLYLSTSYPQNHITKPEWIKKIYSKNLEEVLAH